MIHRGSEVDKGEKQENRNDEDEVGEDQEACPARRTGSTVLPAADHTIIPSLPARSATSIAAASARVYDTEEPSA